jgi:hypothetical protein
MEFYMKILTINQRHGALCKKILFAYLLCSIIIIVPSYVYASDDAANNESTFGISFIPYTWWIFYASDSKSDDIHYNMDTSRLTSYSTTLNLKYLTVGGNVSVNDGAIGKIDNVLGFIEYGSFMTQYSESHFRGNADWNGTLAPGMQNNFSIDNSYQSISVMYTYSSDITGDNKIGVGYTRMGVPTEVTTLTTTGGKENQVYALPVYDNNVQFNAASFLFGFDNLKPTSDNQGLGIFVSSYDECGFGTARLSSQTAEWAEYLNPGHSMVSRTGVAALVGCDLSIGICYRFFSDGLSGIIGIGYDVHFLGWFDFGGTASRATDLGYDVNNIALYHGIIVKAQLFW